MKAIKRLTTKRCNVPALLRCSDCVVCSRPAAEGGSRWRREARRTSSGCQARSENLTFENRLNAGKGKRLVLKKNASLSH